MEKKKRRRNRPTMTGGSSSGGSTSSAGSLVPFPRFVSVINICCSSSCPWYIVKRNKKGKTHMKTPRVIVEKWKKREQQGDDIEKKRRKKCSPPVPAESNNNMGGCMDRQRRKGRHPSVTALRPETRFFPMRNWVRGNSLCVASNHL